MSIEAVEEKVLTWLGHHVESQLAFWDQNFVDPREAYRGPDGELWGLMGSSGGMIDDGPPYRTEMELKGFRAVGRLLAMESEFAISGHENRISYIVGWGHTYAVNGQSHDTPSQYIEAVRGILKRWATANQWHSRQQENLLRYDRDGETFIRRFKHADGITRLRYIEPAEVSQPGTAPNEVEKDNTFGIQTKADDVETVLGYWVSGNFVEAQEIQHRKANVDSGLKRGIPLFWPVRKNLARAYKLLRNMSTTTEIQNAIALIRKHQVATGGAVRSFLATKTQPGTGGVTDSVLRYPAGSILDVSANTQYEFPSGQLDPSKTVAALAAELRAIASRLVMPEFMLSSDASNANFSSTMVAEGPAVKKFERDQQTMITFDLELINESLDYAVESGLLSIEARNSVTITAEPPSVKVRDELKEAQTRQIDMGLGILSPQTATAETGREYETEQTNLETHLEKTGGMVSQVGAGLDPGTLPGAGPSGVGDGLPEDPTTVSATALNGIQIQALKGIMSEYNSGTLGRETAKELIGASFPLMDPAQVARLLDSVK